MLALPNVKEVCDDVDDGHGQLNSHSEYAPFFRLLELFAFGMYSDYVGMLWNVLYIW